MQIFGELDYVLGNAIPNVLTTKQRQQQQQQQQQIQHTRGLDDITIKITVIEYDRISGPELFSTGTVDLQSQYGQKTADLLLTALTFREFLRR
jgi:hypothetical protein